MPNITLANQVNNIKSREDFIKFVKALRDDFKKNPASWENNDLSSYLGSMARWVEDMGGYYKNNKMPMPKNIDWKVFGNILIAATMQE